MLAALKVPLAVALVGTGLPAGAQTRTGGINTGPEAFTGASAVPSRGSPWRTYDPAPELAADAPLAARVGATVRHGPLNPGPLPEAVANTFRSGSYTANTLGEATTLYRVHGGSELPEPMAQHGPQPGLGHLDQLAR